jgi:hypothetical protein
VDFEGPFFQRERLGKEVDAPVEDAAVDDGDARANSGTHRGGALLFLLSHARQCQLLMGALGFHECAVVVPLSRPISLRLMDHRSIFSPRDYRPYTDDFKFGRTKPYSCRRHPCRSGTACRER